MKHKVCPDCNSSLDHGERCDCRDKKETAPQQRERPQRTVTTEIVPTHRPNVKTVTRRAYV